MIYLLTACTATLSLILGGQCLRVALSNPGRLGLGSRVLHLFLGVSLWLAAGMAFGVLDAVTSPV